MPKGAAALLQVVSLSCASDGVGGRIRLKMKELLLLKPILNGDLKGTFGIGLPASNVIRITCVQRTKAISCPEHQEQELTTRFT